MAPKKIYLGTLRVRALAKEALQASEDQRGQPNYGLAAALSLHAAKCIFEILNERAKTAEQMGHMLFNIEQAKNLASEIFDQLAETARSKKAMLED